MTHPVSLDVAKPLALLAACPRYAPSPLTQVSHRGRPLLIKDETHRMGLGAFKALGGVYAVAKLIEAHIGRPLSAEMFMDDAVRRGAADLTFVCASAGNHGMAIAAGARLFGAKARIHLSDTVPKSFARRLRDTGAEVARSGETYEDSVAAAIEDAAISGAVHLADGSWPGYTEPPRLVMEGYTVIGEELRETILERGTWPSHVYLQAGVGGLAAAVAHVVRTRWPVQPKIIVVEPDAAPCLRDSAAAGKMVTVAGPVSNMGRLDCKAPSMLALDILMASADDWVTIRDQDASAAVAQARDLGFATTPSGAAGLAACLAEEADLPLIILSEGTIADA